MNKLLIKNEVNNNNFIRLNNNLKKPFIFDFKYKKFNPFEDTTFNSGTI